MKRQKIDREKMKILREQGLSLSEIAEIFHIAKSSVSRSVGQVIPLPQYKELLKQKRGGSRKNKNLKEEKALQDAQKSITLLSLKEKELFLTALYWAEGSKKDFVVSNTDPYLIQVFVNGLREIFHIPDHRFRISIRIYEDLNKEECLQFWSKIIRIPAINFVSVTILPGKKKEKLPYGMCRVRVSKGEELLKRFKATTLVVHDYFVPIA